MFSIRHKLLISFVTVALLSLPLNIYLMIKLSYVTQSFLSVTDWRLPRVQALLEMKNTVLRVNLFISNFNYVVEAGKSNASTPTKLGAAKDQLLSYLGEIGEWQKIYTRHLDSSEETNLTVSQLSHLKTQIILNALDVFAAKENNVSGKELEQKLFRLEQTQQDLDQLINSELSVETEVLDVTKNQALKAWHFLEVVALFANALVLAIAILIGYILSRWISGPIISLRNFTSKINQDNLNMRTAIASKDEIGDLASSVNKMLENLLSAKTLIIDSSRLAGVAEVATSMMHNIGNILNSVNTSVTMIKDISSHSKVSNLPKLYNLFSKNKDNLNEFINNDERGKLVLPFFKEVLEKTELEGRNIQEELTSLQENLDQIKQVVTMQLSSESSLGIIEQFNISKMLESALNLQINKIIQYKICIIRDYENNLTIGTVKSKLQQIVINLVKNAVEALIESDKPDKCLKITVKQQDHKLIKLSIEDNGIGVLKENLNKIFNFGFTTKKSGHGFGLHSCALLSTELGGKLIVESEGLQRGTVFRLDIPDLLNNRRSMQESQA